MAVLSKAPSQIVQGNLVRAGGPLIGQEYFRIYDQSGAVWNWWISYDLAATWAASPEHEFDRELRFHIIPWWIKLADSESFIWYLYPEVDGSALVEASQPPLGEGITNSPVLRVRGGKNRYQYAIVGGGLDVVSS